MEADDRRPDQVEAEPYGLTWPGRTAAGREAHKPAAHRLVVDPLRSRSPETTGHRLVVGDNLEALRALVPEAGGTAKLIYIDPPYNTGDDRIYTDTHAETARQYRARARAHTGTEPTGDAGRRHSKWLSMMYPRLILGRELMRRDGLFVASIGVEELGTLRLLCDAVFGEDNLVGVVAWRRRHNQPNDRSSVVVQVAEFLLIYARDLAHVRSELNRGNRVVYGVELSQRQRNAYRNPDNDPRGPWTTKPWKAGSGQGGSRYTIVAPDGRELTEVWQGSEATYQQLDSEQRIWWAGGGTGTPRKKIYLTEREAAGVTPTNFWGHDEWGSNQEATAELAALFGGTKQVFENPKPVRLIQRLVALATSGDDLIVDFFAGSGTTAHAVWSQNAADGHNRRTLLIQADELIPLAHKARTKLGHNTVADITVDRLTRAARNFRDGDTGLCVLRLDSATDSPAGSESS